MRLTTENWIGKTRADWGASPAEWSTGLLDSNNDVIIKPLNLLTVGYNSADNYIIHSLTVRNAVPLTTDNWIGKTSADWGASATNWSTGLPNSNSNVVINTKTILTIGFSGSDNYTINSLIVGNDRFDMSGGNLTILTTASFADGFTQTGGTLTAGGAVTIKGAGTLTGGAAEGKTTFDITGTIALANYTLGGYSVLNNASVTNLTGQITLGDNTGTDATINNEKGATFKIGGDFGIGEGAATASFVNTGTLEKTGGSGISFIDVDVTDTGKIVAGTTGTVEFRGPNNSFAGAISGAGQFALGGGSNVIGSGATITSGTFGIYDNGTLVTLGENLTYVHTFNLEDGSNLNLGGHTLTLSGTDTFNNEGTFGPIVDGSGKLVTAKGSTTGINSFTLGGTVDWQNSGTVDETATFQIGDSSFNAATFTNEKGGVYNFTNDSGITVGAALTSRFVNLAGATLEKSAGTGTSQIAVDTVDSGAITVHTGTIEFIAANSSFAGAISGAGQFALGGGSNVIGSGATITSGTFGIYDNGTLVSLGENLTYVHTFNLEDGSNLNLGGHTLTLSGTDTFNNEGTFGPIVDGSGKLVTASGSTTGINSFTLGGTVNWQNSGTVDETATFQIGDSSFNAATFTNEKGGVYNFTNDSGITLGAAATSSFVNLAGATLEKSAGTGTSQIAVDTVDSGAITVHTGTIEFIAANSSFAGAISGAGQFALGGGSNVIGSGATITSGTFGIYDNGTLVSLGENLTYVHTFNLEDGSNLNLGGHTLTLSGTDTFNNEGTFGPIVDGSGKLVTAKGSTTGINDFTLGGTANWQNSGTVDETGTFQIGDSSFNAATFTNEKGGVYNFTNDSGITVGAALTSRFINLAGATLENSSGVGVNQIAVDTVDSGAITVNIGTIEFIAANSSFAGAISGAGQFALGFGSNVIGSGATITTTTFGIYDNGTLVSFGENLSYANTFNLDEGSTLNLGGHTLTLSGTDTFSNEGTSGPIIDGSGALVTAKGSTTGINDFTLGGTANWQNSGTVDETGTFQIGDSSFNAATFTNEKGGVYNLTNDSGITVGAAATSRLVNLAGATLQKTAGISDSVIAPAVTNNGAVTVATGTLEFQNTVSGTGTFTIDTSTVLAFDAKVASGSSVDFAGTAGGELLMADSRQFGAAIHGFGGTNTDELDLRDINQSSSKFKLSYSGSTTRGVLTVTDGTNTAALTMFGNYKTGDFHASPDGFGGTKIVDPTSSSTLLAFAH